MTAIGVIDEFSKMFAEMMVSRARQEKAV